MKGQFSVEQITRVLHEANRQLCALMGDHTQVEWDKAPVEQQDSTLECIDAIIRKPDIPSSELHDQWIADMMDNGWTWGPKKDPEKKTHPCCLSYEEVPEREKVKDRLFKNIVLAML